MREKSDTELIDQKLSIREIGFLTEAMQKCSRRLSVMATKKRDIEDQLWLDVYCNIQTRPLSVNLDSGLVNRVLTCPSPIRGEQPLLAKREPAKLEAVRQHPNLNWEYGTRLKRRKYDYLAVQYFTSPDEQLLVTYNWYKFGAVTPASPGRGR